MFILSETRSIPHSPQDVFDAAVDPMQQLKWDSRTLLSVEKLSAGPLGLGAKYRGNFKGFGTIDYIFGEFEPGRHFAHYATMPMGELRHSFDFTALPNGTQFTQTMKVEPKGIWTLAAPLMRWMLKRRMKTVGEELSSFLETQTAATSGA